MAVVALRLDDVHGGISVDLLRTLDDLVWRGRPVTLGLIPYPSGEFLDTTQATRHSLGNSLLRSYLAAGAGHGTLEVGVHGLTHADHRSPGGPAVAELLAPSPWRVDRLLQVLHDVRYRFGGATLIPPHNFIDRHVAERVLADGFHISRALMDTDITGIGLIPGTPSARAEAKRRCPGKTAGNATELFQTMAIWTPGTRRQVADPKILASRAMDIIKPAGAGVITFHWWSFLDREGRVQGEFIDFAVEFLTECHRHGPVDFTTTSLLAQHLRSRSRVDEPNGK